MRTAFSTAELSLRDIAMDWQDELHNRDMEEHYTAQAGGRLPTYYYQQSGGGLGNIVGSFARSILPIVGNVAKNFLGDLSAGKGLKRSAKSAAVRGGKQAMRRVKRVLDDQYDSDTPPPRRSKPVRKGSKANRLSSSKRRQFATNF